MANILVTGGAGFIGSHSAKKIIHAGHNVIVFDNVTTGFREAIPKEAAFILGDVCDTLLLSRIIKDHKIDAVVHFAAKLNVEESIRLPLEYYKNNTGGVLSLVHACKDNSIDKIVFSSTAAVYGDNTQTGNITEDSPKGAINPYGHSKYFSEQILRDAEKAYGIRSIIFRYFNVAGAALDGTNGQRTAAAYHLIHLASLAAVGKRSQLSVYGSDYPTTDGTCVRDYIHVEDLADIHALGVTSLLQGGVSDVYNCGYGAGFSVLEVIAAMKSVSGVDFPVIPTGRRPGDPARLVADSTKLQKVLKWVPQRNDIELICRTAYDWERKRI